MKRILPSRLASLTTVLIIQSAICFAEDKLSGSAAVSPTGAATYSIAIEAPKGVGDLMPSIGITYNSQSGNGLVGLGCNITGLSTITRGIKTLAHDNTVKGINYGDSCALYLDGKRLLLKSGTEGMDGCVYAPEGEPLTSITLHSSLSSSSCWFEADTNDGMVYEYGHTDGRQMVSNPSAVAAWHISKATNPMGQTITYQYSSDGLYLYPYSISYGGDNSVNFTYEARNDSIFFVLRDNQGYVGKRLKSISTKAGNSTYRTYTMSYDTTSDGTAFKFSHLTNIIETGENGISHHNLTAQWNFLPAYTTTRQDAGINIPQSNDVKYFISGDVNADGISDIAQLTYTREYYNSSGIPYLYADLYTSSMEEGEISFSRSLFVRYYITANAPDGWNYIKGKMCILDLDMDGINDLIVPEYVSNNTAGLIYYVIYGHEIQEGIYHRNILGINLSTSGEFPLYAFHDVNKNGRTDLIALEKDIYCGKYVLHVAECIDNAFVDHTANLSLTSTPRQIFTTDMDNDGLTDLLVICDDGYRIFHNQGGTSLQNMFIDSSTLNTSVVYHKRMEIGDFNGDGISDLIWNDDNSDKLYFEIGNANGTFTLRQAFCLDFAVSECNQSNGTWSCQVIDLDHDGKSDIVLNLAEYLNNDSFFKSHTYWLISNGISLTKIKEATSNRESDAKANHIFAGDFKGNGYLEVANYGYDCYNGVDANANPVMNIYSCSSHGISNGRVSYFQDSNGRKASFDYASMSSNLVYTRGGATYPLTCVAGPICVTSQVTESGGSPLTTQTQYTYKSLLAHLSGRGLLGFREITAKELNSGKKVKTTIDNLNYTYYVPTRTTVTTIQDGNTATTVNAMTLRTSTTSSTIPSNNYLLLPSTKTHTDIYGHETVTTCTYDPTLHYLTKERTVYDNNDYMSKQTQYYYYPNKIGGAYRLWYVNYMQWHQDDEFHFEKYMEYTYDNYGRMTSVTDYPYVSLPLVTSFEYDSYGNITKKKYAGYGISNDTETNYQYSSDGKFLTQKSDIAQTIGYTRNVFGDITAETDLTNSANPLTTTYTRNGFGTLLKEEKPTGDTIMWIRTASSSFGGCDFIATKPNNGPTVKTWYDAFGNEMRVSTKGIGNEEISTTNTYNTRGELTTKTIVHGSLTTTENYTYDGLGRMTSAVSSNGSSVEYSYDDREVTITKNGQTYTKYYDAWGNVYCSEDPVSFVNYYYNANGKPSEVCTNSSTVDIEYDECCNQISLNDPDAGLTTYEYDALHRVISQTDARGNTTTFSYDGAGRITQKNVSGTTTAYIYGTSGYGAGRLVSEQTGNCTTSYVYNNKGQLSQKTYSIAGEQPLNFIYTYNDNGTLATKTYPQGITVNYFYQGGHCIESNINNTTICFTELDNGIKTIKRMGGRLKFQSGIVSPLVPAPTSINLHPHDPPIDDLILIGSYYVQNPKLTSTASYDSRGYLTKLATERDSIMFSFQSGTGNLLSRTGMTSQTETFAYDNLERLTLASGNVLQSVDYDNEGNICEKTEPGVYTYDPSHAHAVVMVTNPQGSISSATQIATYNAIGKVAQLSDNGWQMDFTYGPNDERWKTVLKNNGNTVRTTLYAENYERITENGQTRHFYYLDGGVIYVLNDGASIGTFYYSSTDHLGSITRIYSSYGTKVFSAEYDAWGKQTVSVNTLGFHRGYTGHEMLPEFGLINMNGRLYDPILGRFLSPDNYVQMPDFSQSFNRYSYCLNNPLKYTDPSGELLGIDDAIIIGVCIAGAANVWANWDEIHHDWGHGIASFFLGVSSAALGMWNPALGAVALGAGNSILNQTFNSGSIDWEQVGLSTGMSLITLGASQTFGSIINNSLSGFTNKIENDVLRNWLDDAIDGTVGGFAMGTLFSLGNGEGIGSALENGGKNALQGFIIGSMNGLNQGVYEQRANKAKTKIENKYGNCLQYYKDEFGNIKQIDLRYEIDRIESGKTYSFRHDNFKYYNNEGYLPKGEYKEWVVPTPGVNNRAGRLRIITGEGHMWFMPNHHKPPLFLIK